MSCHYKFVNVLKNIMVSIFPNALYLGYDMGNSWKSMEWNNWRGLLILSQAPCMKRSLLLWQQAVYWNNVSCLTQAVLKLGKSIKVMIYMIPCSRPNSLFLVTYLMLIRLITAWKLYPSQWHIYTPIHTYIHASTAVHTHWSFCFVFFVWSLIQ